MEWVIVPEIFEEEAKSYTASLPPESKVFILRRPCLEAAELTEFWQNAGVELPPLDESLVADFYAIGFARLGLEVMLQHMGHGDELSRLTLWDEVQLAAEKLTADDPASAGDHLQSAFDLLQAARQSVYPASISLLDFALWDGMWEPEEAKARLDQRNALNMILNGQELEAIAKEHPAILDLMDRGLTQGTLETLSGSYDDRPWGLIGTESRIWQLQRTFDVFDEHLKREVDCFAARHSALVPDLPMLLQKFHFRYALHVSLDGGRFPNFKDPKIYWASPDGSSIESHTRTPLDGSDESLGLLFAARLGRSLMEDRAATLGVTHWASSSCSWFRWLLRVQQRSNIFGRFELFSDFFINSMMVEKTVHTYVDEYASRSLIAAVRRDEKDPVSRWKNANLLRGEHDAASAIEAMVRILAPKDPLPEQAVAREDKVEQGEIDRSAIAADKDMALRRLSELLLSDSSDQPGYLLVNPCSHPRRAAAVFPGDLGFLPVAKPIRGVQVIKEKNSTLVVVDLPGWGYVWIPKTEAGLPNGPATTATPASKAAVAEPDIVKGRHLRNEYVDVEIDARTGGIRAYRPSRSNYSRLSQRLVVGSDSSMIVESTEVTLNGPVVGEIRTRGVVQSMESKKALCRFTQTVRVYKGRPHAEIEIELSEVAELGSDPINDSISCRWEWPDDKADLSTACGLCMQTNPGEWIETSSRIRLRERNLLTEILAGGATPFHRRVDGRTLDSLLVVKGESARNFVFDVALDLAHGWTAVYDQLWPLGVVNVANGPPVRGRTGWIAKLQPVDVICTRFAPEAPLTHAYRYKAAGDSTSVRLHLIETRGEAVRATLRSCRDPAEAQLVNARGQLIFDLGFSEEMATVDMAPHEIQAVRLCYEEPAAEEASPETLEENSAELPEPPEAPEPA